MIEHSQAEGATHLAPGAARVRRSPAGRLTAPRPG